MDIDKAREIIHDTGTDLTIKNRVPVGMMILSGYAEADLEDPIFEHDQIWYVDFEETVAQMGESTVTMLAKLGWFEDEDAWSHFS